MSIHYVPVIASDDYDAFFRILDGHIPSTYDEWLKLHTKELADYALRLYPTAEIEIYPDEFLAFLRANGTPPSLKSLESFTVEKADLKAK